MIVTWVTFDSTLASIVEYGNRIGHLDHSIYGSSTKFQDGGSEKRILYIHRVILVGLVPGETYCEIALLLNPFIVKDAI